MKKEKIQLKTTVAEVTCMPEIITVDVEIGKGQGTKGKWTIGWSYILGCVVLVYEDGQVISASTPKLMETMVKLRK